MSNSNYSNKVYLIVGARGRGKTTEARRLFKALILSGQKPIAYDPRRDFVQEFNKPFLNKKEFTEKYISPAKNSVILLEEATVFFPNTAKYNVLNDKLVACRYDRNDFILIYHSLQDIPAYILRQTDYLTLFKTSDSPAFIESKYKGFPDFVENMYFVFENAGNDSRVKGIKSGCYNFKNTIQIN